MENKLNELSMEEQASVSGGAADVSDLKERLEKISGHMDEVKEKANHMAAKVMAEHSIAKVKEMAKKMQEDMEKAVKSIKEGTPTKLTDSDMLSVSGGVADTSDLKERLEKISGHMEEVKEKTNHMVAKIMAAQAIDKAKEMTQKMHEDMVQMAEKIKEFKAQHSEK